MAKLIICCDGTWNDEADRTHIHRLFLAAKKLAPQSGFKLYYGKGVGTKIVRSPEQEDDGPGALDTVWNWFGGGTFGTGISLNIRDAYAWLAEHYKRGDEIYMFGFSRGAYTVRSLCGFINYAGLMTGDDLKKWDKKREFTELEKAYTAYRTPNDKERENHEWLRSDVAERARPNIDIQFLGVFDTVGALGIPIGWMERARTWWDPAKGNLFHDTNLGALVRTACHALAIDERRGPYRPTLWTGGVEPDQRVLQTWFAGAHSDVGGGYEDKALGNMALNWMLAEAAWAGLDLRPGFEPGDLEESPVGKLTDSTTFGFRLANWLPSIDPHDRPIGMKQRDSKHKPVPGERVHWSAIARVEGDEAASLEEFYRPKSLVPRGEPPVELPDDVGIHGKDDAPSGDRQAS